MSEDSYTEVTEQSWFSRIGGAIKGIIFGFILFLIAFPLLFWNEGRAVKTYKTLKEGGGAVISVASDRVDPSNEGKLIHLSGKANTEEILTDPVFGVADNALRLLRKVEMYQWQESSESETKKKLGGGTETVTTYSYSKGWEDNIISSSSFKKPEGHENPGAMPYTTEEQTAQQVTLGAFQLSTSQVKRINGFEPLAASEDASLSENLEGRIIPWQSGYYLGADSASPQVGDVRIQFESVAPTEVSIVAQQSGSGLRPYHAQAGGDIELLQVGVHTAEAMFQKAQTDNKILTWALRVVGFLVMMIGLSLIFKVFSVLADVIPFLGNIVEAGTGFIAFLLAAVLSLITIAVAWIVFRPLLAIILLVAAVGLIVLIGGKVKAGKAKRMSTLGAAGGAGAVPPPPPPGA
ncbi:TMEM43 family protein [Candidatus Electrothrix sp.]|uniref:TMEM43 family protein n=1 Tax=Candidatus Electrothrix sp. TaxID=2170559 RepID=UPI004056CD99